MEPGKLICVVLIIVALFLFATSLHRVYKVKSLEGFTTSVAAETTQAGTTQAGTTQAGTTQAGTTQAGTTQAGTTAAGGTAVTTSSDGMSLSPEDFTLLEKLRLHEGLVEKLNNLNRDELQKLIELTSRSDTGDVDPDGNPIMEDSLLNKFYDLKEPIRAFSTQKEIIQNALAAYNDLDENELTRIENIKNGLTSYKTFHDEYNEKLHEMLDDKFSKSSSEFLSQYDLNKTKIQNLKGKIDELRDETNRELTSNNIISIKNLDNGERLNLKKIRQDDTDLETDAQRYLLFANNNCLSFNGPREYGLKQCEMTDQSQHFLIDNIKNKQEYEVPINIIRQGGVKKEVTEFDDVSYDFNLIYPYNSVGSCLSVNDGNIKFVPCSIENNQRFNVSDRVSVEKCN